MKAALETLVIVTIVVVLTMLSNHVIGPVFLDDSMRENIAKDLLSATADNAISISSQLPDGKYSSLPDNVSTAPIELGEKTVYGAVFILSLVVNSGNDSPEQKHPPDCKSHLFKGSRKIAVTVQWLDTRSNLRRLTKAVSVLMPESEEM